MGTRVSTECLARLDPALGMAIGMTPLMQLAWSRCFYSHGLHAPHHGISSNQLPIVKLLLDLEVDIEATDSSRSTPLVRGSHALMMLLTLSMRLHASIEAPVPLVFLGHVRSCFVPELLTRLI